MSDDVPVHTYMYKVYSDSIYEGRLKGLTYKSLFDRNEIRGWTLFNITYEMTK